MTHQEFKGVGTAFYRKPRNWNGQEEKPKDGQSKKPFKVSEESIFKKARDSINVELSFLAEHALIQQLDYKEINNILSKRLKEVKRK